MSSKEDFPVGAKVRDNGKGFAGIVGKHEGTVIGYDHCFIRVRFEFLYNRERNLEGYSYLTPGELLYRDEELELA